MSSYEAEQRQQAQQRLEAKRFWTRIGVIVLVVLLLIIFLWMAGMPRYRLWRASVERQIMVVEATARADSAIEDARAEIERARGVAESNMIVADSLTPEYLRYHYINTLAQNDQNVIYIPTEAGLPILEAGSRVMADQQEDDS